MSGAALSGATFRSAQMEIIPRRPIIRAPNDEPVTWYPQMAAVELVSLGRRHLSGWRGAP